MIQKYYSPLNLLSLTTLFILIFDPAIYPLKIFGGSVWVLIICLLVITVKRGKIKLYKKNQFTVIYIVYISIICVYSIFTLFTTHEFSYIRILIRTLISIISLQIYCTTFQNTPIIKNIITVFILNSLFLLIAANSEALLSLSLSVKAGFLDESMYRYNKYRVSAISGNGFFGLVALYSIFLVFYITYLLNTKKKLSLKNILIITIVSVSGILVGRFMIIPIILSFVYILLKDLRKGFLIFIVGLVAIILLPLIASDMTLSWLKEIVPNNKGQIESFSIQHLISMYEPINKVSNMGIIELLIGENKFTTSKGNYYLSSDVGFIRNFFFGGFILIISMWASLLYILKAQIKYPLSFILIIATVILLEAKGTVLLILPSFMVILLLFSFVTEDTYEKNLNRN